MALHITEGGPQDTLYGVCGHCEKFVVSDQPTSKLKALEIELGPCPKCGVRPQDAPGIYKKLPDPDRLIGAHRNGMHAMSRDPNCPRCAP